ncbi:hypothetical protein ATT74_07665 [Salmonella enterica subsp. enterica serovar Panama]|uniref:Uncharacterized protein n=1 Tax=Salmonella enterica subsp. enterica serovar Panama TaxID=29472 RepID=A0A619AGT7_SALET|nr:hypothetical protein [Salmonella enterica subsp. enterica serovar Panama]ECX3494878.1 hypothetical protein [Salmonella enterica subsp. enterica serovar Panama]ECX6034253.1 hypothetical protein [Salmonella enterica subsp. enterica serovar Panama]EGU5381047.1 hypothetical protein [Salmonella enterica]EGX1719917.1 hypothetical protein [Salmonella enterica subsp. enterica serovar Panama]
MPVINMNPGRSHHRSPLVEDVRMDSLRGQLLSLIKSTEAFIKNDSFMCTRLKEAYKPDEAILFSLLADWLSFRDDCRSAPFSRFRILNRLRLQSWIETADEQLAKLESFFPLTTSQVIRAGHQLLSKSKQYRIKTG